MKKSLIILIALLLVGCSNSNIQEDRPLSIVCPSGAPSLAFYNYVDSDYFNTADAQNIIAELNSESGSDIVVIDTISGIRTLNKGAKYELAATITFGNFYIVSTGIDDNDVMEESDYIVLFSQNGTPDIIFHYIYGDSLDSNIHYVGNVSDALGCVNSGINIMDDEKDPNEDGYVEYVMIAEPALTMALSKNENARVYANIQDLYYEKTNCQMVQASVFVSKRLSHKKVNEFLNSLENDIDSLLAKPSLFSNKMNEVGLSDSEIKDIFSIANSKIAEKVLSNNSIGLGYKYAYDNKENIDNFVMLYDLTETNNEIYFK